MIRMVKMISPTKVLTLHVWVNELQYKHHAIIRITLDTSYSRKFASPQSTRRDCRDPLRPPNQNILQNANYLLIHHRLNKKCQQGRNIPQGQQANPQAVEVGLREKDP